MLIIGESINGAIQEVCQAKLERKELKDEIFLPPSDFQRIVPESSKK